MYGFQDLASQQQQRFWVYTSNGVSNGFQTWSKPPGISFIHIIVIGAAGGGGGAFIWTPGVANRGGGGGGTGAMTSIFLPAYLVPDILYINVGLGGSGGASSTTTTANVGTQGTTTYVTFYPLQASGYTLGVAAPGGGGGAAAGTGGGIGGGAAAAALTTAYPISQIGLRNSTAGQVGVTGQTGGGGTVTAAYRITGGAGGTGKSAGDAGANGGGILAVGDYALQSIAASPAGTDGSQLTDLVKFIFAGGTSPGSSASISGSNGGNGGYCSGGGGGSTGPGRGGAGGKGGDGLVIITCG